MYTKKYLLLISICICLLEACNLPFNNIKKNTQYKSTEQSIKNNNTSKDKKSNKYISKYTGEYVDEITYKNTPFMAIIENSKPSRPQSGLNCADIVYETSAEGGIPRFIALFQKNPCKKIGPIRSARNYFIDIANEYNLPFAHCGGSSEALNRITQNHEKSINEIAHGDYFVRDKNRKPPHNLYTSSYELEKFIKKQNYNKSNYNLNFNKTYWENANLSQANKVNIKLNDYYKTSYSFKNNKYIKSMDDVISIDALDNNPVYCNNIVIQITNITLQEDNLHLNIRLKGKGKAYVISNGKFKKAQWLKEKNNSKTILLDEDGNSIPLCPGKTWWHIVNTNSIIEIQ